jgi:hypothetical protein
MGDTWMHFFPADPLLKPDWPRLRKELLQCGFILEPRGANVPAETVVSLWESVATATGLRKSDTTQAASLDDLVASLVSAGRPIDRWAVDTAQLTISEFLDALRSSGTLPADFVFTKHESYLPGPLFETMCDVPHARYGWNDAYLYPQDFGDQVGIEVGENMLIPPGIPNTDRVVEEWDAFFDRWLNDSSQFWTDPETGRQYGILDLDWENSFSAGKFMLSVFSPGYLNGDRVASLVGELVGQSFRYSYQHI